MIFKSGAQRNGFGWANQVVKIQSDQFNLNEFSIEIVRNNLSLNIWEFGTEKMKNFFRNEMICVVSVAARFKYRAEKLQNRSFQETIKYSSEVSHSKLAGRTYLVHPALCYCIVHLSVCMGAPIGVNSSLTLWTRNLYGTNTKYRMICLRSILIYFVKTRVISSLTIYSHSIDFQKLNSFLVFDDNNNDKDNNKIAIINWCVNT